MGGDYKMGSGEHTQTIQVLPGITPPSNNQSAPENWWLGSMICFQPKNAPLSGDIRSFSAGTTLSVDT